MYILNSTNMELEPSFVYLVADKVKSQWLLEVFWAYSNYSTAISDQTHG